VGLKAVNLADFRYLYKKGSEHNAYNVLGAHIETRDGINGVSFRVYAPNAKSVFVAGDFNDWKKSHPLINEDGIWSIFVAGLNMGQFYKYIVVDTDGKEVFKADPYAFYSQLRAETASVVGNPFDYRWSDKAWMQERKNKNFIKSPINIYEVQLSSFDTVVKDGKPIDLRKTGKALVDYAVSMNYTHIEVMPVCEYPLDGSWGYQCTGYFSLSGRYSSIKDFQYFVNLCHKNGLGIILDWVPGHFCPDEHGLYHFDGTPLYGSDLHPQWGTYEFDFKNKSVWSFLLSSAVFWAKAYHIDGIRVDGVSSMLYLNYGRDDKNKENVHGGEDDLAAKEFLQYFNKVMHKEFGGFLTFAEEATSYKGVTAPISMGGLGFDFKWNMGWMNDTLDFFEVDFDFRNQNFDFITFSSVYMRDEQFTLPLSHDEVVHGKKQLIDKMPGEYWRKFAGLRTLMTYQTFYPGKKLNFMGNEIAQSMEWRYYEPIEWFMLDYPIHDSFHKYVKELNRIYKTEPALYDMDSDIYGFEWIDADNKDQNVFSFLRRADDGTEIIVVLNFSIYPYSGFRLGVNTAGDYTELISSDCERYDGTGVTNGGTITSEYIGAHKRGQSIVIDIPPVGACAFKTVKK
jgi:1,4-alpha-glucan branching enzyme